MRYTESSPQSAEILRLVLPRIARHGGHYAPTAYTVWYEHLAGINPALSAALESHLQDPAPLDHSVIEQLCTQHIRGRDARNTDLLQAGLGELIRKLTALAASGSNDAAGYAQTLAACERELGTIQDTAALQRVIGSLVASTAAAREATEQLRASYEAGQAEMQSMRQQLGALKGEALTDLLTGLHNRRGFEAAVTQLFGHSGNGLPGAAILLADIDHFKRVNDTYGHLFGDQVIRACGQVLSSAVKGRDVAARFGGEEFLVLLPSTPGNGALALAEQIRVAFSRVRIRRTGSGQTGDQVTISIGVAVPTVGETLEQVIERADQALYQAKHAGRNCVRMAGETQ